MAHKQKPGWANGSTGAASCHSKASLTSPVRGHTKFLTGSRARGILSILNSPPPALKAGPPRKQLRSNQFLSSVTHWSLGAWPMPGEGRYERSCSGAVQKLSCSAGVPRDCRIRTHAGYLHRPCCRNKNGQSPSELLHQHQTCRNTRLPELDLPGRVWPHPQCPL